VHDTCRFVSLLHLWNAGHSQCPQANKSSSRVQVRSGEELSGTCISVEWTLKQ
jgi:hypothetical protein